MTEEMTHHDSLEPIPGTEVVQADFNADKALIPRPSTDPRDPLNWSMRWKSESQQLHAHATPSHPSDIITHSSKLPRHYSTYP